LLAKDSSRYQEAEKLYGEAKELYGEAKRLSTNSPDYKYNLAILLATDSSRYSEVKELYREAIQLSPNNPDYKYNLAILLATDSSRYSEVKELYREAMELYGEAKRLSTNSPWFLTSIAYFYQFNKKDPAEECKAYKKALIIMEHNPTKPKFLTKTEILESIIQLEANFA